MKGRSTGSAARQCVLAVAVLVIAAVCGASNRPLDGSANDWQFGATGPAGENRTFWGLLGTQQQQSGPLGPQSNTAIDEETLRLLTIVTFNRGESDQRHDLPDGLPVGIGGFGRDFFASRQPGTIREVTDGIHTMHIGQRKEQAKPDVCAPPLPFSSQPLMRLTREDELPDIVDYDLFGKVDESHQLADLDDTLGNRKLCHSQPILIHKSRTSSEDKGDYEGPRSTPAVDASPRKSRRVGPRSSSVVVRSSSTELDLSKSGLHVHGEDTLVLGTVSETFNQEFGTARLDPNSEAARRKRMEAVLALRRRLYGPEGVVPDEVARALAGYVAGGRSKDPLISLVRRLLHARKSKSADHALSAPSSLSVANMSRSVSPSTLPSLGCTYALSNVYRSRPSPDEAVPFEAAVDVCGLLGVPETELRRLVDLSRSTLTVRDVVAVVSGIRSVAISPVEHGSAMSSSFGDAVSAVLHGEWFSDKARGRFRRSLTGEDAAIYDSLHLDFQDRLERLSAHDAASLAMVERLYMHAVLMTPHVVMLLRSTPRLRSEALEAHAADIPRHENNEPDWHAFVESQWAPKRRAMTPSRSILTTAGRSRSTSRVFSADSVSREDVFGFGQPFVLGASPYAFGPSTVPPKSCGSQFSFQNQCVGTFFLPRSPTRSQQSSLMAGFTVHSASSPHEGFEGRGVPLVFSFNTDVFASIQRPGSGVLTQHTVNTIPEVCSEQSSDNAMEMSPGKDESQLLPLNDAHTSALVDLPTPGDVHDLWKTLSEKVSPAGAESSDEQRVKKRARRVLRAVDTETLRAFMRDALYRDAVIYQRQLAEAAPVGSVEARTVSAVLSTHAAYLSAADVGALLPLIGDNGTVLSLVETIAQHIEGAHNLDTTSHADLVEMAAMVAAQRFCSDIHH